MTSAGIFKVTLRNHTQVFLNFRDSIIEICLNLIIFNCTLDFLLSLTQSSGARTSNEIPLQESGFLLPARLITLPIFIDWNQLLRSDYLTSNYTFLKMASNLSLNLKTLMFFIRRLFLILQRYQVTTPEKWSLYHQLHRLNHKLWQSMTTQMSPRSHTDLDGSSRLFHQA